MRFKKQVAHFVLIFHTRYPVLNRKAHSPDNEKRMIRYCFNFTNLCTSRNQCLCRNDHQTRR